MRQILLFIILFNFSSNPATTQSWCPPGATWTYSLFLISPGPGPSPSRIMRVTYVGDTLIEDRTVQRLDQWDITFVVSIGVGQSVYHGPLFTYVEDEVVYLKRPIANVYDTLFNLNASPGDLWTIAGMPSHELMVLDTLTSIVDGIPLRQVVVDLSSLGLTAPDTITARIGFHYLYMRPEATYAPEIPTTTSSVYGLRCYPDYEIEFTRDQELYCGLTVGIPHLDSTSFSLYPNPGIDHFTLQLPPGPHQLTLFDAQGRMIFSQQLSDKRPVISTASLPSGIYHIHIADRHGRVSGQRWIKE